MIFVQDVYDYRLKITDSQGQIEAILKKMASQRCALIQKCRLTLTKITGIPSFKGKAHLLSEDDRVSEEMTTADAATLAASSEKILGPTATACADDGICVEYEPKKGHSMIPNYRFYRRVAPASGKSRCVGNPPKTLSAVEDALNVVDPHEAKYGASDTSDMDNLVQEVQKKTDFSCSNEASLSSLSRTQTFKVSVWCKNDSRAVRFASTFKKPQID